MTDHVLVPVDGSPLSLDALRHALTTFPEANVTVLHVIDLAEPGYGTPSEFDPDYEPVTGSEEWYERAEEYTEDLFETARDVAADHGREVTTVSEVGDPKRAIVEYADESDVDHIVVGAHGRSDPERTLFGSVAELVARRATVPVTLVR